MPRPYVTDDELHSLVQALREKAEYDDGRAAELRKDPPHVRMADTFAHQAKKNRALADRIEDTPDEEPEDLAGLRQELALQRRRYEELQQKAALQVAEGRAQARQAVALITRWNKEARKASGEFREAADADRAGNPLGTHKEYQAGEHLGHATGLRRAAQELRALIEGRADQAASQEADGLPALRR